MSLGWKWRRAATAQAHALWAQGKRCDAHLLLRRVIKDAIAERQEEEAA